MIEFRQVSKRYGAQIVLDAVDFRISPGQRIGIVGPNGAGKSTLFEIAAGSLSPDSGTVVRAPGIRIGWLHQQLPALSGDPALLEHVATAVPGLEAVRAEIDALEARAADPALPPDESRRILLRLSDLQSEFEHHGGYDIRARAAAALSGLGFRPADEARPLSAFSGGWRMRAELARVLLADPDVLLLDEPSNYLDLPAVEWLRRRLDTFRGTLAMISHDRYLLDSLCPVTLEVAAGRVTRFPGPYSFYAVEREKRRALLLARQANEDRRREQIERFVDRFRSKNTLATRVQSKIKMLERMEETRTVVAPVVRSHAEFRLPEPERCGQEVLRCENLGFAYPGGPWIFRSVSWTLLRGEKTAVVGPNGAGKTTLLRILAGSLSPCEGACALGHRVFPGYQSQDAVETMDRTLSAFEVVRHAAPKAPEADLRALLGAFGFSGEAAEKRVEVLSGGERVRLAFARLLSNPPNLLLLDEPTSHLDVESREALQDALRAYGGTIVLVSHDVAFVRAVADHVVAVAPEGGGVRAYPGGYDYFLQKLDDDPTFRSGFSRAAPRDARPPEAAADKAVRASAWQDRKAARNELKKVAAALEEAERAIAAAEAEIARLQQALCLAPADVALAKSLKEATAALPPLELHWETLQSRHDTLSSLLRD